MKQADIVRIAREAGYNAHISNEHFGSICYISQDCPDSTMEKFNRLEHFAKLVAQDEREACIKAIEQSLVIQFVWYPEGYSINANRIGNIYKFQHDRCVKAIQARRKID